MMLNIAHELTWRYFNAVRLTCPVPAGHRATAHSSVATSG
ncbi:hypothetical protein SAMN05421828_11012 [Acidiphilium rubrum]|jgi:hypothetical protein|uniref:Uncharacterized protein n=1 Tax=Acidiphilium rubrum TaxID=526 RepID=A0A8G2CKN0_ACIRU|nr:hypothetical protein SAMN05421828_11012 [Acidiphilium rubrum]